MDAREPIRRWWRRLDEVIMQQQLRDRADAAYDEQGDLADAIAKIDRAVPRPRAGGLQISVPRQRG